MIIGLVGRSAYLYLWRYVTKCLYLYLHSISNYVSGYIAFDCGLCVILDSYTRIAPLVRALCVESQMSGGMYTIGDRALQHRYFRYSRSLQKTTLILNDKYSVNTCHTCVSYGEPPSKSCIKNIAATQYKKSTLNHHKRSLKFQICHQNGSLLLRCTRKK